MREKRKYKRIYADVVVRIAEGDLSSPTHINTQTLNISSGGAYCPVSRYIPPLIRVQLTLLLPFHNQLHQTETEFITCQGIVVRTEPEQESPDVEEYRIGILFSNLDESDRRKIHRFIMEKLK
ncbi:MAG: hypothetical protein B6244_04300 [Candidatus Cloacimonetes bacterium 4572_55]|nr:MAG: hypothetical protein B6244_04300 [Candidatus Cloacimonetes bacterium 4572_55]